MRIDGVLTETVWRSAEPVRLPFEVHPGQNAPAPVETECRFAFDRTALYVACQAWDSSVSEIRTLRTRRDDVEGQDRIGFTIDPFSDRRRGWEFAVTPLGVQYDAVLTPQGLSDASWDAIWTSAGRLVPSGYVIEAAIPFKSLRFPSTSEPQSWRIFVWRRWPRSIDVTVRSSPVDPTNACLLCQAEVLAGLNQIAPGRNIEMTPSLTATRTDHRPTTMSGLVHGSARPDLGMDLRWSVTPDVTLNATANPDFSHVEADVAQLEANTRFALSYPERRPFFLEGADLFATPRRVIFTRAIADPSAGVKFTSKIGRLAGAALVARDAMTNLLVPGHETSIQASLTDPNIMLATRLRRDVGVSSVIGLVGTARSGSAYRSHIAGLDALLRPHRTTVVVAQALYSTTDYPDSLARALGQPEDAFDGSAAGAQATFQTREVYVRALGWRLSRGFRADAGFVEQVGISEAELDVDRSLWGRPGGWYTRLTFGSGYYVTAHDTASAYTDSWRFAHVSYEGPWQSRFRFYARHRRETYRGVSHAFWTPWIAFGVSPTKQLSVSTEAVLGGEVDYATARLARTARLSPRASFRIGKGTEIEVRQSLLRLTNGEERLLSSNVSQARVVHHFSPALFVRMVVQRRSSHRPSAIGPGEVPPVRATSLLTQLLASYRLDAQSAALLGYGDLHDAKDVPNGSFTAIHSPLRLTSRTFFAKLSYAWRP